MKSCSEHEYLRPAGQHGGIPVKIRVQRCFFQTFAVAVQVLMPLGPVGRAGLADSSALG